MLSTHFIREHQAVVVAGLQKKHFPDAETIVAKIIEVDELRRQTQKQRDDKQAEANALAKQIGLLMKQGEKAQAQQAKVDAKALSDEAKHLQEKVANIEKDLFQLIITLPNLPHETVPVGSDATDNELIEEVGTLPSLSAEALPHWELITKYDIIDFETGSKVTGTGFPIYKGKGAKLQRALINFFLDEAARAQYTEVQPPILINKDSGFGTGQLPDKDGQMYVVTEENFFLIPTAEVPITNMYRDAIIETSELPIKCVGYTPCFRREAGNWGADVRGLNRLHQFDKVEIVQIQHPDKSYDTLEEMRQHVQQLLEKLALPYRVLKLCGGDLSFTSALTYDLEVYSAAQQRWLEVSSVSNFESYQANRLKLRYRDEKKKTHLLHTLNGSALALPRILAALLENNQTPNGIEIPEVLHAYTGFTRID
ncbi:MAG: serine--tRNA ligase [Thermonemataceae bacterium]